MATATDLLFLFGVAFLLNHELDAIQQHEWRFFFAPTPLSDATAYRVFTGLHIPLFVFVLWNLDASWFQVGFDSVLILHALVHWIGHNHPRITFNEWFSSVWIYGGAVIGVLHLALLQWG
jgi:hypothetical protein